MSSVNQVTLLGRVGQEPKSNTAHSGTVVTKVTLATSRKYQDKEETQWHNIVVFGKAAEFAAKHIHKGDCIVVIGEIKYEKYTNKEGKEMFLTSIYASNIQLCAKANNNHSCPANDLPEDVF